MTDNSTLPVSIGTEVFANDDIGGVKYPRVKATWGPDGTANDTDVASGKPMPVQLRVSDGTAFSFGSGVNGTGVLRIAMATDSPPGTAAYSSVITLTRTADTNAYAANDIIGAATGSTAGLDFALGAPSAGRIMITSAALEIDATAVISGETSYRLYLYNITPPSATGDNGAWDLPSGDRASFLGYVDLGTPVDLGSTLYVETNGINKQIKLAGTDVFAYLTTIGAYTPTSARVYVITLHAIGL